MNPVYRILLFATCSLVIAAGAAAQANNDASPADRLELADLARGPAILGGGLIFGEPTGFSIKLWFPETGLGFDAAAAWSFREDRTLYLHANALYHLALIETQAGRYLVPFVGLGVTNSYGDDTRIGLRVPVGLSILPFPQLPLEFFAEMAPGVGILPDTSPDFGAGIGARFYLPL